MRGRRSASRWLGVVVMTVGGLAAFACGGDDSTPTNPTDAGSPDTSVTTDGGSPDTSTADTSTADAGGPVVSFNGAAVDLGAADCGGAATTKTVEFTNTGGKPLTLGLSTSGAPFTITPSTLTVAPGAKGTVTVSVAVPSTATAGTAIKGTVDITTNDPSKPKVTVPVSITPQGATLAFNTGSPTAADFGNAPIGVKDADINLTLKNVGNKPAAFTFGPVSDSQFSIATTPASPATLAVSATVAVVASFTPSKLTASSSASNITVVGAVCGTSVNKVSLSGQGTVGAVSGWPTAELDFGTSPCGGGARAPKSFTLTNTGSADVTLTSVSAGTKGYTINVASGAVITKNGGTLVVTVTPPAIPAVSSVPGNYGDAVAITTNIPNDAPHSIPLSVTAFGAIIAFDTSATPSFGNFGPVPVGTTATQKFSVTNSGNGPSNVSVTTATPFGISQGTFTLTESSGVPTAQAISATFSPTNTQPQTGSITLGATGLCQPLPSGLPVSGTGQNGGIALSSNALSFTTACNTTAATQTFTITNTGNQPMTWTGVLGRGATSPYTVSPATATLAKDEVSTVTVTPNAIPQYPSDITPSAFADTFTITTDIVNDTAHAVSLSETPIGAVLAFNPGNLGFPDTPVNTSSQPQDFHVVNTGNPGSTANLTVASSNGSFVASPTTGASSPGTDFASTLTFSPGTSVVKQTADITITTPDPICAMLPSALKADGTGTLAQVVYDPPDLDFSNVNCGATAAPQQVTFTNPGNQDYTINGTIKTGTYFTIAMTPATGIVPKNNGGSVVLTVTPKAIPATVAKVPDPVTYSDELTVTTNAAGDTAHKISLTMGAKGLILRAIATNSWDFGTVNFGATGYYNLPLKNDGNVSTTVTMSGFTQPVFGFSAPTIAPGTSTTITGTFTPTSTTQSYADSGTLTLPPDAVLCQPLPNLAITMIGKGGDGAILTITGGLAFPPVDCGNTPNNAQTITVRNNGNTALPYTTSFNIGTYYAVSSGGSGTVAANGGSVAIVVQPVALTSTPTRESGAGAYGDQFNITINSTNYALPVSQTARGAMLTLNGFTDQAGHRTEPYECWTGSGWGTCYNNNSYSAYTQISNSGNGTVTYAPTITSGTGWTISPPSQSMSPGASNQYTQFDFGGPQSEAGARTLNMTFTGPVCRSIDATQTLVGYYDW